MSLSSSIPDSNKNPIWKKVIRVGDKPYAMVVVIDESFVKELAIDQECWLEQIPMRDGIFLRVSHDAFERATSEAKKEEVPT